MKYYILVALIKIAMPVCAQVISNTPLTTGNSRFTVEVFSEIKRPALTLVGFDNQGNHSKGYGLKQVLNLAYVVGSSEQKIFINEILGISNDSININPSTRNDYNTNSNILQYRAFEALASYVLEKNGINSTTSNQVYGIPMRDHQIVLSEFKNDILLLVNSDKLARLFVNSEGNSDYVKDVGYFKSIANAIDLYLALENAYGLWDQQEWANGYSTTLFTSQQKHLLLATFNFRLLKLNEAITNGFLGVNEDETEPGNRPLKGYMTLGYGVLGTQLVQVPGYTVASEFPFYKNRAMSSGSSYSSDDHMKKWMYQSDNGKRMWAEGPYYLNFVLMDAIPFWHALRANSMLNGVADPFHSSWFINPLQWLADVTTPDGLTPPINDGNKHRISAAPMLRWSAVYGNMNIGKVFNGIYQTSNYYKSVTSGMPHNSVYGFGSRSYLMQLAIPTATESTPLEYSILGAEEQQTIYRRKDVHNQQHYIFLNTETSNSIDRGDGHQQPDNMQLLYYVDDVSYLMDSGYDAPKFITKYFPPSVDWIRSSWNNYSDHNVMIGRHSNMSIIHPQEPGTGIKYPVLDPLETRIDSHHTPIHSKSSSAVGNIDIIQASTYLNTLDFYNVHPYTFAFYDRTILIIKDDNSQYMIDLNSTNALDKGYYNRGYNFRTTYHVNASQVINTPSNDGYALWPYIGGYSDKHLFIYPSIVERTPVLGDVVALQVDDVMEYFDKPSEITKLNIYSRGSNAIADHALSVYASYYHTSVAFIEALIGYTATEIANKEFLYNSSIPNAIRPDVTLFNDLRTYQYWTWQRSENTIDLFIARSAYFRHPNSFSPMDIEFEIPGIDIALKLPMNKEYGFVRFTKINNVWQVDMNYRLNLELEVYNYTTSQTINNVEFPMNSEVEISDNQTLTITGEVKFNHGTMVTLGTNASIVVSGSGKLTADGTTFTSVDPTNSALSFNRIELNSVGNSFTNSVFKGGNIQNVLVANGASVFTSCTFSHSQRGLNVLSGGHVSLVGSTVTNNNTGVYVSSGVVTLFGHEVHDAIANTYTFTPTSVHGNSGQGVHAAGSSHVYMGLARVMDNTGTQIQVGNDAMLHAEVLAPDNPTLLLWGHNRISKSSSGYYIYSTARTQSGETYQNLTIPARYNYWGSTSAPAAERFFGSINRSDHLSFDPTIPYIDQQVIPCVGPPLECIGQSSQIASQVLSSSMAGSLAKSASTSYEAERLIVSKERILAIRNHISAYPDDPFNARLLREWHGLLQGEGSSSLTDEKQIFSERIETRKNQHAAEMVMALSAGRRSGSGREVNAPSDLFRPDSELEPKHLIGETAWILSLAELANKGEFEELLNQAGSHSTRIYNADNRASVQLYRMQALQSLGRYEEAIAALNELERIQPSADMQAHYIAQDYGPVRRYLAELAGVSMDETLSKSTAASEPEASPHAFALHPSYPNPFNPTTTIRYSVGGNSGSSVPVLITVFDLLGREVAVLVNERKQAGEYSHVFDASGVASGIYLVHARLGTQVFSHKITLIK